MLTPSTPKPSSKGVNNDRRRFGLGALLAIALLVGVVGVVAYGLGLSAGTTEAAIEAGSSVIDPAVTLSFPALPAG
jgi:hypothetical protein